MSPHHADRERCERVGRKREEGASVAEFALVMTLLVPLVLGIAQVGLVLHVRNTAAAAASEGARTSAPLGADLSDGVRATKSMIRDSLDDRYADDVTASFTVVDGIPATQIRVRGKVPALGVMGPSVPFEVTGHAIREVEP